MPSLLKPNSSHSYVVYGLRIQSDGPIAGLIPVKLPHEESPEISVWLCTSDPSRNESAHEREFLWYTSDIRDERGNPLLKIWKGETSGDYRIRYSHGLQFRVDQEVSSIAFVRHEQTNTFEAEEFLLGPVLGIVLRLRGVTCLHASSAAIAGKAILFVGSAGTGKSTTAGLFVREGHPALADDIVPLRERGDSFEALPGYPCLNLWPESLEALRGSRHQIQEANPTGDKQQWALSVQDREFRDEAVPVGAIYLLGERRGNADAPHVEGMSPQDALVSLIANTYANKLLDGGMRAREFELLGRLVNRVSVRRVVAHKDLMRLEELHEVILQDLSDARRKAAAAASR